MLNPFGGQLARGGRNDGASSVAGFDDEKVVSERTQCLFEALAAAGADQVGLLALVSSAYADGGNYVLDDLIGRLRARRR